MQVIYTCLVIVMFITGTGFGYIIGRNGFIQFGTTPEIKEEKKLTAEEQLANLMNYEGKVGADKWRK